MLLGRIKRALFHNGFLKLFSLGLATLLWFTIATETNSVINRPVALEFQGLPSNMEITGETATQVNLQLRGPSGLLSEMSPADVAAVISLRGQDPGDKSVQLTSANIQTPFGVEVLRIDPPRVQFRLERTLSRTLPVRAVVEGEPAADYALGEVTVNPATVQVVGPESRVLLLETIPTTSIRVDDRQESLSTLADLNVLDPLVRLPTLSPHSVFVEIREVEAAARYRIPVAPSLAPNVEVTPGIVEVVISGPKSMMTEFDPQGLTFTVETANLAPGSHETAPRVVGLEPPFTASVMSPETVRAVIR